MLGAITGVTRLLSAVKQPVTTVHKLTKLFKACYSGNLISLGRIPFGAVYLLRKQFKEEYSSIGGLGNVLLTLADISGGFFYIVEKAPLKFMLPFGGIVPILYIIAYVPLGLNAVLILGANDTSKKMKVQASLDLSNAAVQVALAALVLLNPNDVLLVPMAIVAGTIGGASFTHRIIFLGKDQDTTYRHTITKIKRFIIAHLPAKAR